MSKSMLIVTWKCPKCEYSFIEQRDNEGLGRLQRLNKVCPMCDYVGMKSPQSMLVDSPIIGRSHDNAFMGGVR